MTDLLVVLAVIALLVTTTVVAGRVRRLHRLHQRLDAARAALDAALARRARAARAAGLTAPAGPGGPWDAEREDVENALGAALARLDRTALPAPLRAELADAEQLAALGRTVHNDAVRDALALRTRRLVRWLRLAGTAPMPVYAEFTTPVREAVSGPRGR